MKHRLLVMMHEHSPHQGLVQDLRARTELEIEHLDEHKEAFERLIDHPPEGLLAVIDRPDPHHLELLAALEAFKLRIPILVLKKDAVNAGLPFAPSPFLTVLEAAQPTADLAESIRAALARKRDDAGPILRVVDYLQLAVLGAQSVTLDLHCSAQQELHLELVGGDLWNAYRNDLDGDPAILPVLYSSPSHVKVRPLQKIPFERTFKKQGLATLFELHDASLLEEAREHSTQAIDLDELQEMLESDGETVPINLEESLSGRVETLLTEGLEAALARDYQRALEIFEEAAAIRPEDPRVVHNLQRIRQRLK